MRDVNVRRRAAGSRGTFKDEGTSVRTIAIINQKGGCGKTTVAINLAATLAAKQHRTLLVDMDPQAHCALGLAVPDSQVERSVADLLKAGLDGSIAVEDITWQISRHFDLAPSAMSLAAIEQRLTQAPDKDRRLAQVLSTVNDRYDLCIIDCPPSIGLLTFNALRAADEVIIPVETGYFAMQGSVRQEQTIQMLARRVAHRVRFSVLATMYDVRTKLAREILSELKKHFGDQLLPMVINFNSKLKEAASFGQPITEYDPASRGMQDFEQLADWLMTNPPEHVEQALAGGEQVTNPAMSRAAELAERARSLVARTAALSSRMASDHDFRQEALPPAAQSGEGQSDDDRPVHNARPPSSLVVDQDSETPEPPRHGDPRRHQHLAKRLASMYGVRQTSQGLLFIQPDDQGRQLAIAGDFNDWNPQQTPMMRNGQLGLWQAVVNVPPGRYHYKLVVDGQFVHDPYNKAVETNPYGEENNVVDVADA